jgi:hypothetical protein
VAFAHPQYFKVGYPYKVDSVKLTPEEQQKLKSLHEEVISSRQNAEQAQITWLAFQSQLVRDHVGEGGSISFKSLPSGRQFPFPTPWANGAAFTSDYQIAVPQ